MKQEGLKHITELKLEFQRLVIRGARQLQPQQQIDPTEKRETAAIPVSPGEVIGRALAKG